MERKGKGEERRGRRSLRSREEDETDTNGEQEKSSILGLLSTEKEREQDLMSRLTSTI